LFNTRACLTTPATTPENSIIFYQNILVKPKKTLFLLLPLLLKVNVFNKYILIKRKLKYSLRLLLKVKVFFISIDCPLCVCIVLV